MGAASKPSPAAAVRRAIPARDRRAAGGAICDRTPRTIAWKTGPDWDYSASPSLATMPDGKTVIIAAQKQGVVRAHDPDKNGAVIWEQDVARRITGGGGETVFGGAVDDHYAYFG